MTLSLLSPDVLFASAHASVHFALVCLEPNGPYLRAKSSFVDPDGAVMHWHDFGDLEGPGWAANAVGGAHLLYRWGVYVGDNAIQAQALSLLDHILHDGFVLPDGFIWPYWELAQGRFCLNYKHNNDWLCPGSLAKVGVQLLDFADDLDLMFDEDRAKTARAAAHGLGAWLMAHMPLLESGWIPRRITQSGAPYPHTPEGGDDPMFDHSADGLFMLALCARLGTPQARDMARRLGDVFVDAGGLWGSINHDTYDDHENVAYAVAFRELRRIAASLGRSPWRGFVYDVALPAMQRFRMLRDAHEVVTRGLFWMEESWDTAYLWENAEVAQAHLEAWLERGDSSARDVALATLSAIAHHHYGAQGFLTEGVDWNNHVGQEHHIGGACYAAIRYTEPLLNNLHFVMPTLTYFKALGYQPPASLLDPTASIHAMIELSAA